MEKQGNEVSAKILLEAKDAFMHRFINNKKSLFTSGNLKIAKIDHSNGSTIYFINMNSFYYTLRKQIVFVKLVYDRSFSYLFPHFQNGLSAISLARNSPQIHNLEQIFANAATFVDYNTAMNDPEIRIKIETHCKNIDKVSPYNPDGIKQAITTTGKLLNNAFVTIGQLVKQGLSKAGQFLNTKLQQGQNNQVNPQTKQKWQSLKKGTSNILKMSVQTYNQYLDPLVKPVVEKGKQQINLIKDKINQSENQNVKYAKELAETTQKALEEAFDGLLKGGKQVGEELSTQTKKIVQKKLGDDYVKTFIEGEQEHQRLAEESHEEFIQISNTQDQIHYPNLAEDQKN